MENIQQLNKVYVVIESTSVDYHGTYHEIVQIFANREDAEKKCKELMDENYKADTEYFIDAWNVN